MGGGELGAIVHTQYRYTNHRIAEQFKLPLSISVDKARSLAPVGAPWNGIMLVTIKDDVYA